MTLGELLERLEEYCQRLGDDAEVRLMTQPSWPFENRLRGLASAEEIGHEPAAILYLVEGEQIGYGSKDAWNIVG